MATLKKKALDLQTAAVFEPLLRPARYKGAWGGRGSGKSHVFAENLVEEHVLNPGFRSVCLREIQKSIKFSSKQLIADKIQKMGFGSVFEVQDQVIKAPGGGIIIFQGLQSHTADSIKSLEGFNRAWIEEAQSISEYSWSMLRPTMRADDSEIWASWNPLTADDPIDKFFRGPGSDREDMVTVRANWSDNPWFASGVLADERRHDMTARPDEYDWVWEGAYRTISEAAIFRNKFEITDFETPDDAVFYHGADWGFAKDPSALVRCFIQDDCLYIDQECYEYGVEIDHLPKLFERIDTARKWPIKGDSASPQIISYLRRQGFNIDGAKKWANSVEEGISFVKSFKKIFIHRRCENIGREFRIYSWKQDQKTGMIIPKPEDKDNHAIDALRYALNDYIIAKGAARFKRADLSRI